MKKILLLIKPLALVILTTIDIKGNAQANQALSNLTAPVAINQHILPNTNNTKDLGSNTIGWRNIFVSDKLYLQGDISFYSPGTGNFYAGRNAGVNYVSGATYNTGLGHNALYSLGKATDNTAVGAYSMYYTTGGIQNTAVGSYSLNNNSNGIDNTSVGSYSLYNNSLGSHNTAIGFVALYSNTASSNTACGDASLRNNTTGASNTAIGASAMYSNTSGKYMVALGESALYNYSGNSGYNTAIGNRTLYSTTTGYNNSALGYHSLYYNTTGYNNSSYGYRSLYNNTSGYYNTAYGINALYTNKLGFFNTALGSTALFASTGSYNTAVGSSSDVFSNATNATAIGFGAFATASNQIMLGNSSVSVVRTYGNVIWISDGRFKKNIKENVPGLEFIKQLRPVTYNYDIHKLNNFTRPQQNDEEALQNNAIDNIEETAITQKEKKIYSGFVAQEVEKIADKMGFEFSGVYKPQNEKDTYGLDYAGFVIPLVKSVQELSKLIDEKDAAILHLQKQIDELKKQVTGKSQRPTDDVTLEQNSPNPFSSSTTIRYHLPSTTSAGQIVITNTAGYTIKTFLLNSKGSGTITIDAGELKAGSYHYTLYVNGKRMDSKQMLLIK